jgi:Nif-specific regulatory protein
MSGKFTLLMKSTSGPRRQWALSERRLVIGRGRDCDLVVFDPMVSRRHCELWVAQECVQFQDLGSANTTQVNGREVHGGMLSLGDEIRVGDHTFTVALADEKAEVFGDYDDQLTPRTISVEDTPYYAPKTKPMSADGSVDSFKSLVQCSRNFNKARTVRALCEMMQETLRTETGAESSWIVLFRGEGGDMSVRAEFGAEKTALPETLIDQSRRQDRGMSTDSKNAAGLKVQIMVAPMRVDGDVFGSVAAAVPYGSNGTDPRFHYFVALTHAFAPIYRGLERSEQAARDLERWTDAPDSTGMLVGRSLALQTLRSQLESIAASNMPVLVLGETGTGKELVSRLIHNMSGRADRPYVVVNCPAIPRELFESMIFGHRKGSFTGANESREGYFAEAQGGTIFLDEIGDLPLDFQSRLLRVVETGAYRPVGGLRDLKADVRIVAATNRPSSGRDGAGAIRSDLYHRLAGFEIKVPPLRQRREDIGELADHFLRELAAAGRTRAKRFSAASLRRLAQWDWPGNVRELKLCVERAGVLAVGDTISEADVTFWGGTMAGTDCPPPSASLEDLERWHLERAFKHFDGNISATAQSLGISRSTAYEKLRQFGIKD